MGCGVVERHLKMVQPTKKESFKPTSTEKSGVDEGSIQVPTYLGLQSLYILVNISMTKFLFVF